MLDLTAHLLGLSGPLEAAKALNADFGLGLPMDGAPDPLAAHRRQTEQARLAAFEGWCKWACGVLIAYHRLLRRWRERYAPKAPEEQVHPRFVEALHMEAYVEYLFLSVFIDGDFETRASFYKTHQGEIVAYEQRCKVTAA